MPDVEPQFPEPLADALGQFAGIVGTVAIFGVVLLVLARVRSVQKGGGG